MQTVKVFIVGPVSLRENFFSLSANTRQIKIIGVSDCPDEGTAETIIRLQPQAVIHSINAAKNDSPLVETVKKNLLDVCYITLCEQPDLMYRVRYSALGVNHILDQRGGLDQIFKILLSMTKAE